MLNTHRSVDGHLVIPPFGDPNQALFNGTGNLSPEVADSSQILRPAPTTTLECRRFVTPGTSFG